MKKNKKPNLDIDKFNKELLASLKTNSMNFAQFLMAEKQNKLSVVAKFDTAMSDEKGYSVLDENLESQISETKLSNFYYGISPKISATFLINAISTLSLTTKSGLVEIIKQNRELFTMHASQRKYLYYFAESALITLTSIYGIELFFKNSETVKEIIENNKFDDYFLQAKAKQETKQKQKAKEQLAEVLQIRGCPTAELLNYFKVKNYKFKVVEGKIFQTEATDGMSIEEIYADKNNVKLMGDSVFYSGVLLRALQIEKKNTANADITAISIHFERSTYATVYAISNAYKTQNHPFLSELLGRKPIVDFLYDDDVFAYEMYETFEHAKTIDGDFIIETINKFLNKTYCVQQIGVSGNLTTADGVLLISGRAPNAIDAGQIYPGVNGNAEIADGDVEFYSDSTGEDFPDLKIEDMRKDFFGELNREAYAELGVTLVRQQWQCEGLAIIGRANEVPSERAKKYSFEERRIHFSIICEQKCDYNFLTVVEKQKTSTEKYENNTVEGIRYKCYKNIRDLIRRFFLSALKFMLDMKNMVTSLLSLVLFIILVKDNPFTGTIEKYVSIFFSVLVCLSSTISAVKWLLKVIKKERAIKRLHAIKKFNDKRKTDGMLKKMFLTGKDKNKINEYETKFHPTTFIAVKHYLEETSLHS